MSARIFLDGKVTLHAGDCLAVLAILPDASVDSVVTDPPYGLSFMGKGWDHGVPSVEIWQQAFRVLKPGGHLLAFFGTRTYHRGVVAIEDAGFDIRDQIGWCFGSGFPKSHDVSKGIDKARRRDYVQAAIDLGVDLPGRSVDDWTKEDHAPGDKWWEVFKASLPTETWEAIERRVIGAAKSGQSSWFINGKEIGSITAPATDAAKQWEGWGTALKPAWEPIVLARRPLNGTVAQNVLQHGTGAINVNGCRVEGGPTTHGGPRTNGLWVTNKAGGDTFVEHGLGRWPANLIHDGSEEVLAAFPETQSGGYPPEGGQRSHGSTYGKPNERGEQMFTASEGSAARFFYQAKADSDDRLGSKHPTVKPVDLMQWLVRLVTPKGGVVLDPFAGTGTTGEAAWREGMRAVLIEREPEYQADIARRMELATNPTKRAAVAKTKNQLDRPEDLPLFALP